MHKIILILFIMIFTSINANSKEIRIPVIPYNIKTNLLTNEVIRRCKYKKDYSNCIIKYLRKN